MINYLYRIGYSTPLLKCITNKQAKYILTEIHEGVYGNHGQWPPRSWRQVSTGRPSRVTVPSTWRNVPSARSSALCTTQERKSCTVLSPHDRSPSGEWTLSVHLHQENGRPSSSWWESTTLPNGSRSNHLHKSRLRMFKILYGKVLFATHNNNW